MQYCCGSAVHTCGLLAQIYWCKDACWTIQAQRVRGNCPDNGGGLVNANILLGLSAYFGRTSGFEINDSGLRRRSWYVAKQLDLEMMIVTRCNGREALQPCKHADGLDVKDGVFRNLPNDAWTRYPASLSSNAHEATYVASSVRSGDHLTQRYETKPRERIGRCFGRAYRISRS